MSLITRCPACATQFKVVPDQLKLSGGWVRCGHCSDVFDANRYLESQAPGAAQPKPSGVAPAPTLDLTPNEPGPPLDTHPTQPRGWERLMPTPRLEQATTEAVDPDKENALDFHIDLQRFAAGQGNPPEGSPVIFAADPAAPPPTSTPQATATPKTAGAVQQVKADHAPLLDGPTDVLVTPEPGFVRQARRRAFWRSPGVRALLMLVALLLSALLAAQWALQERDRLAARHPDFQPLLAGLCKPLGCTIGAVRDLQAVVIDSATLTRRLGNFYAFDLVLKNTSALALAVPALELSLTDPAGTVISRRVFLPDELPGIPPLLPPQSTVSVSLRLSLPGGSELPMAGYRALVFYP